MRRAGLLFALIFGLSNGAFPAGTVEQPPSTPKKEQPSAREVKLRVMTYNLHSCKGRDGRIRPDRIAEVINREHPDVVALEEIRVGRVEPEKVDKPKAEGGGVEPGPVGEPPLPPPTVIQPKTPSTTQIGTPKDASQEPFIDQPRAIAEATGMGYVFYPLVRQHKQDFGIALLSRYPFRLVRAENLPLIRTTFFSEQRGALWAEVTVDGLEIQVVGTHLGLSATERTKQVDVLTGPNWLGSEKMKGPFVLLGDFNSSEHQTAYKRLAEAAKDASLAVPGQKELVSTFPSGFPVSRIDHVFIPKTARATFVEVPRNALTRVASDHLPVVVDVVFSRAAEDRRLINVPVKSTN
ncbi:MAG: endonuclease/exonuclease/phosphatase family protein [Elusimicrobia bacterium]|nr:endonuclease/exonuclease/phosphatase family protein [Elusimicrobiota bacterium]